MLRTLALAISLLLSFISTAAIAQDSDTCELHVWPTSSFFAVYHGASGAWGGGLVMTLTPMQAVAKRLGESIDPGAQVELIRSLNLDEDERFQGYRLIFHEVPSTPKYSNWIAKDVGAGNRDTGSRSQCYAELHVVFITLFRTAISKKIQTGFLFRQFGSSSEMTYKAVDAGSTGAPDFKTNSDEKSEAARLSARLAFQENLRIFLKGKNMRSDRLR